MEFLVEIGVRVGMRGMGEMEVRVKRVIQRDKREKQVQ